MRKRVLEVETSCIIRPLNQSIPATRHRSEEATPDALCRLMPMSSSMQRMHNLKQPLPRPSTLSIAGASGFIGSHLLARLADRDDCRVRVLTRQLGHRFPAGCEVIQGDLADGAGLDGFLGGSDLLINLAWPADTPDLDTHRRLATGLAEACLAAGVGRVLHVSTATVVGRTAQRRVNERTPCDPGNPYERSKLAVEEALRAALDGRLDYAVLRPTAVFGPGSLNLRTLAATLTEAPAWRRQALRFLQGRRRMHLVPVEDVVDALLFLAFSPEPLEGETYIVSADRHPANHYQAVDALLGDALGVGDRAASAHLPGALLSLVLRLRGRSQSDPYLHFDAAKLAARGFVGERDFAAAVRAYGEWYRNAGAQA